MLQLAIIGLGGWGRTLVDSIQDKSDSVRFSIAVVTRPESSADYAAARGLDLTTDLATVLGNSMIDGIVSCGPAHLHAAHSLRALEAGKPVLAIKPMALTATEAEALATVAERRGLPLALGYNRCFFPNVAELRRRLHAGVFGELLHAEGDFCVNRHRSIRAGSWKADPANAPAGSLADHMLYLTIETLGRIAEVHALGFAHYTTNDLADTTAALLRTVGRQSAALTAIGVGADYFRFQVFGTNGWAELRDARHFTFQPLGGKREELTLDPVDAERAEVEAFASAIRSESPFPVPLADAVHAVAVLEAMGRSAVEQRAVHLA